MLALLAATSSASAHIGHVITRAERYLKLDATDVDARFVVSLTLGAAEGRSVLALADTDESGSVEEAEMTSYLASWAEGLRTELPIEVDGAPLEVSWTDGWMDPIGPVRAVPVTVEMVAHLPLSARAHRVVVRDRMVRREVFDRTDGDRATEAVADDRHGLFGAHIAEQSGEIMAVGIRPSIVVAARGDQPPLLLARP